MSGIPLQDLSPHERYKLLCGVVVPRPIALVTTLGPTGVVNAAPFSFFNIFSELTGGVRVTVLEEETQLVSGTD